jgi:hypothetical protein
MASLLHTVRRVSPGAAESASICRENDREDLSRSVSPKFEVRAPCRGDGSMPSVDVIEDSTKRFPLM